MNCKLSSDRNLGFAQPASLRKPDTPSFALVPADGLIAMLLRTDFDRAKTRRHLFGDCVTFAKKLVLTKRIRWFEGSSGSPSFNHAWYLWDARHCGPPTLAYA